MRTMWDFWQRVAWLFCLLVISSEAVEVEPCDSGGEVEVEEGSTDVVLGCTDLRLSRPTLWHFQGRTPGDTKMLVANCTGATCSADYSPLILASMNQQTRRSHVILPNAIRVGFPDGTWFCENGGDSAQCVVDIIHKAENAQCSVVVDEEKSMVTGKCQFSKMYSSQGDYSCTWFEGSDSQTETELLPSQTQLTLTNCSVGQLYYVCGNCSFQKPLPVVSGGRSYRAEISPGKVSPSVRYVFLAAVNTTVPAPTVPLVQTTPTSTPTRQTPFVKKGDVPPDIMWTYRYEGVGIGVGAVVVVFVVVFVVIVLCRRQCRQHQKPRRDTFGDLGDVAMEDPDLRNEGAAGGRVRGDNQQRRADNPGERASAVANDYMPLALPIPVGAPRPPAMGGNRGLPENGLPFGGSQLQSWRCSSDHYSSIADAESGDGSDSASYLHPVSPPLDTAANGHSLRAESGLTKGGQPPRTLPPIPGKSVWKTLTSKSKTSKKSKSKISKHVRLRDIVVFVAESTMSVDNTIDVNEAVRKSGKRAQQEVGGGHVDQAFRDGPADKGRADSSDRRLASGKTSLPCLPPSVTACRDSVLRDSCTYLKKVIGREEDGKEGRGGEEARGGGGGGGGGEAGAVGGRPEEEGKRREEEENARNEDAEKAIVKVIGQAFQEKGADYIYLKPDGIPLSEPM
ncbi:uncharacterized protein LOC143291602 isoform X2 [Babylonia areolata]|uniref:uncharacterized protein LOC143291602 isoform X2 n=1 Tax=Babylonia areolata TaxID=304850 RepID=UPI003FD4A4E2